MQILLCDEMLRHWQPGRSGSFQHFTRLLPAFYFFVLFAVVQINSFLSVDETTEKFPFSPSQKKTNAISQLGSFICAVSQSVRSLNPFLALRFKFRLPPNVQWPLFNFLDSIFRRYPLLLQIARR